MQGTAHAAKEKAEEQPAQSPPQRAEQGKGKQVPVKTQSEEKKPLTQEEMGRILKSPTFAELSAAINFLRGRMKPNKEDETYTALKGILPDEGFFSFKKGTLIFQIPPEGSREADIFWEFYKKEWNKEEEDRSFIRLQVDTEKGIVIATNILYMPPEMEKIAPSLAASLEKILASFDEELIGKGLGIFNRMRESFASAESYAAEWRESSYQSETANFDRQATRRSALMQGVALNNKVANLAEEAYGFSMDAALECANQIYSMAQTGEIPAKSNEKLAYSSYWRDEKERKLQLARMEVFQRTVTGADAEERIKGGIAAGLYSSPEIAFYQMVSNDLAQTREKIGALEGKKGAEQQREQYLAQALSLVGTLEMIAAKTDLESYRGELSIFKGQPSAAVHAKGRMREYTDEEKFKRLSANAVYYCNMMEEYVNGMPLLKSEDKKEIRDAIYSAKESIKNAKTPAALSKALGELKGIGEEAALTLSERYELSRAENPKNPWQVRASAYVKFYTVKYSAPLMVTTTVAGGAIGGIAGGAGGIAGGAKIGFDVGGAIVGTAALFVSAEAMCRYFASEGFEAERAIEDLRTGAVLMMFAAGGGPLRALSKPLSATILASTATANAVLLQADIRTAVKTGDPMAYMNIPSDVAFIAIGGMGFVRTFWGGFRPVNIGAGAADIFTVADSAGIASMKLTDKVSSFLARPLAAGYSPKWFGVNVLFGGAVNSGDIYYALKNGKINPALTALGKGFTEMTGQMVGFDFVLCGIGRAGKAAVRAGTGAMGRAMGEAGYPAIGRELETQAIRLKVPAADAKFVKLLEQEGLANDVFDILGDVKPGPLDQETAGRVLEISYGSGGKVSPDYVQKALGLEGEQGRKAAVDIAEIVSKRWSRARTAFAQKSAAGEKFWKDEEKRIEKNRARVNAARLAKKNAPEVAVLGSLVYFEVKVAPEKAIRKELYSVLYETESNFISGLLANQLGELGFSQVNGEDFFDGVSAAFSLAKEVTADKKVTLPSAFESEESAKRFMLSCACALLMNGRQATREEIISLASKVQDALADAGMKFTSKTPVDGLAMLASLVLNGKEEDFIFAYKEIASTTPKANEPIIFNYAVSIYHYAAISGKGADWERDASPAVFQALLERGMSQHYSATEIALIAQALYGETLSSERIWEVAGGARQRMAGILWNMPKE